MLHASAALHDATCRCTFCTAALADIHDTAFLQDNHWRRRWEAATDDILARLVPSSQADPELAFTSELHGDSLDTQLEHLACFWPGEETHRETAGGAWHRACSALCSSAHTAALQGWMSK